MSIQIYEFSGIFVSRIRKHTGSEGTWNSGRLPGLQLLWLGAVSKCFVNCQPWAVTAVSEKPVLLSHLSSWKVFLHLQPLPSLTSTASFQLVKRGNSSFPWMFPESSIFIYCRLQSCTLCSQWGFTSLEQYGMIPSFVHPVVLGLRCPRVWSAF